MAQGLDHHGADPDMQVPGWEKITKGTSVTFQESEFKNLRVLEIADPDWQSTIRIFHNFPGNKGERTMTFVNSRGESMLLPVPDDLQTSEIYRIPDPKFELSLCGDGAVSLMAGSDEPGVSYRLVHDHLSHENSRYRSVPEGEDAEFDGLLLGDHPVAVSTHRKLGMTKYSRCNEDSVGFNRDTLVVADGMGSSYAPELTATFVVDMFLRQEGDLKPVFDYARCMFQYYFAYYIEQKKMQSDAVLVAARFKKGNKVDLLSVGDARWRLIRNGFVLLSSHDASVVQEMVDDGKITERERYSHSQRHIVTSSFVVGDPQVMSDVQTEPGDALVLYSDGMDSVTDEEMAQLVSLYPPHIAIDEMNRLVTKRNTKVPKNAFSPHYLRAFHDGQPSILVPSPMDNGTVAVVRL